MKSYIVRNGEYDKPIPLKNLGWLLRHWKEVKSFSFNYEPNGHIDGQLMAGASPNVYFTDFASLSVLWKWLNRPVFRGLTIHIRSKEVSETFTIGDERWKLIQQLPYPFFMNRVVKRKIRFVTTDGKFVDADTVIPNTMLAKWGSSKINVSVQGLSQVDSLKYWDYIKFNENSSSMAH